MIKLFLKGLPYKLTQPMFREYESKCKELAQWRKHSNYNKVQKYLKQSEVIEYLFAMGIYYRYVIAPLTSTGRFFERLETNFEAGLKVGGREIDSQFRSSIQDAHRYFVNVIQEFGLSEAFFGQTDVKRIVMSLIEVEERRADAQD